MSNQKELKAKMYEAAEALSLAKQRYQQAEAEYLASFGAKVGDVVKTQNGQIGWIKKIFLEWDRETPAYEIGRMKKDGTPSQSGILHYYALREHFEVI